jgi:hypothetical protein
MTLQEAIEAAKRIIPYQPFKPQLFDEGAFCWEDLEAIATILNAVVKGELK